MRVYVRAYVRALYIHGRVRLREYVCVLFVYISLSSYGCFVSNQTALCNPRSR